MTVVEEISIELGYDNPQTLLSDWSLLLALSKVSQYQAECQFFAHKYGLSREAFADLVASQTDREDFTQEADLEDWEFAHHAQAWWQAKVETLQHGA